MLAFDGAVQGQSRRPLNDRVCRKSFRETLMYA